MRALGGAKSREWPIFSSQEHHYEEESIQSHDQSCRDDLWAESGEIVKLLQRQNGATPPEFMKSTGWQAYGARGFISGTLNCRQGFVVTAIVEEGKERRYVIVGAQ